MFTKYSHGCGRWSLLGREGYGEIQRGGGIAEEFYSTCIPIHGEVWRANYEAGKVMAEGGMHLVWLHLTVAELPGHHQCHALPSRTNADISMSEKDGGVRAWHKVVAVWLCRPQFQVHCHVWRSVPCVGGVNSARPGRLL